MTSPARPVRVVPVPVLARPTVVPSQLNRALRDNGGGLGVGEQLLTGEEVAGLLRTTSRFVRRLVAERRIAYVKAGRHVRFTEAAVREYIARNSVEPLSRAQLRHQLREIG